MFMPKEQIDDLAVFGAAPAFEKKLHVGQPNVGKRDRLLERINDALDKRWFTNNGPYVQEFEKRIADFTNTRHCIAVCNGTVALEIAIRALGLSGEVIVPSMTFIATAHALKWQEITPVFCDINVHTYNIDFSQIESLITPKTTGIIGVHLWGRPCDTDGIGGIAKHHGLKLLYDAAHAFGCSHNSGMIGGFGDAEVFSFHATKFVNTFEGGAIVTNNDGLAEKIRLMKNFGFCGYDNVIYIGTNGKMNEISAAMGLTSLESMQDFIKQNRQNYQDYKKEFAGLSGIKLMEYDENERCNYQYIVLEVNEREIGIKRDNIIKGLWSENILARRYFYPGCHRMEPYCSSDRYANLKLPITESLVERVILLPTGTTIGRDDIAKISQVIKFIISHAKEIEKRIEQKSV